MSGLVSRIRALRRVIFRRRHRALIDALRRSNELLAGADTPRATTVSAYHAEEVVYIRKVNRRLLREYDPDAATDRSVR